MKIIFEKSKCLGCGACVAVCPKYWEMTEDNKSHLKNSKIDPKNGTEILEIKKIGCAQEAVQICPIQCIHIEK